MLQRNRLKGGIVYYDGRQSSSCLIASVYFLFLKLSDVSLNKVVTVILKFKCKYSLNYLTILAL
jgi:hypothetical protein